MSFYFANNHDAFFIVDDNVKIQMNLLEGQSFDTVDELFNFVSERDDIKVRDLWGSEIIVFSQNGSNFYAFDFTPRPMQEPVEKWLNEMTLETA